MTGGHGHGRAPEHVGQLRRDAHVRRRELLVVIKSADSGQAVERVRAGGRLVLLWSVLIRRMVLLLVLMRRGLLLVRRRVHVWRVVRRGVLADHCGRAVRHRTGRVGDWRWRRRSRQRRRRRSKAL
jgi:hypothetical protein